jgi:hypothetical protein
VGFVNSGLDKFLHANEAQSNFPSQIGKFYDDVQTITAEDGKPACTNPNEECPTLNQVAGDENHSSLRPGWLWDLAMKDAGGNPDRAVKLIGVCGNDDTYQGGSINAQYSAAQSQKRYDQRIAWLNQQIVEVQDSLHFFQNGGVPNKGDCPAVDEQAVASLLPADADESDYQNVLSGIGLCENADAKYTKIALNSLQKYRDNLKPQMFSTGPVDCPTGFGDQSSFFLPQSLGKGVDISNRFKKKLARTRVRESTDANVYYSGITPGAQHLPAKYYHVYGGALVACEMIARGHSPAVVIALSDLGAWYYRVLALSGNAPPPESPGNPENNAQDAQGWVESIKEVLRFGPRQQCMNDPDSGSSDPVMDGGGFNPQVQADAYELIRRWTLSGGFGFVMGASLDTNLQIPFAEYTGFDRPANWSKERYKVAKAQFDALMIDFTWTIKQHDVGARFAVAHCKPDPLAQAQSACRKK